MSKLPSWNVYGLGKPFRVSALTKSEARARVKQLRGTPRKERLPIGVELFPAR